MLKQQRSSILNDDGVLLCGYFKKLKTMKKKFFVLFNETPCNAARIEYYDNEKKYKSGFNPKRIIKIKSCFNINRRLYTKHDFVIVLASKEGGFGIVMDSEDEMNTWLNHLLHLQRLGETSFDFPKFDYVWQVIIQKKGVAEQHNLFGNYHICLTSKSITFIKIGREKILGDKKITKIEVLLTTIRRCGDSQCYFYMEIGRQSSLGPGELWMETEDSLTAQNMHKMILSKMISLNEALIEPMRKRSSSATETTNLDHDKKSSQNMDAPNSYLLNAKHFSRDRCDSLPSRNRTSSECSSRIIPTTSANRITNSNSSNTSQIAYSASEESVSVDDSEESNGMPYLISSRSPEGVIPEEFIDDGFHSPKGYENTDQNSIAASSMGAESKTKISIIQQCGAAKMTDVNKDIWNNVDNHSRNTSTQDLAIHQCQLCNRYHSLRFCRSFLVMGSTERIQVVRRHRCCINCLARTHTVYECDSPDRPSGRKKHHQSSLTPTTTSGKTAIVPISPYQLHSPINAAEPPSVTIPPHVLPPTSDPSTVPAITTVGPTVPPARRSLNDYNQLNIISDSSS